MSNFRRSIPDDEFNASLEKIHKMDNYELVHKGNKLSIYKLNVAADAASSNETSTGLNQKLVSHETLPFDFDTYIKLTQDIEKRVRASTRLESLKLLEKIDKYDNN